MIARGWLFGIGTVLSLVLGPMVPVALGQTPHPQPTTSPYLSLRYDEDWSSLKDQPTPSDPLNRLKYIPLGRPDFYLTLAGDMREQYEFYNQYPAVARSAHPKSLEYRGAFEQRYQLDADLRLTPWFRFFGQYESTFEDGRKPAPNSSDRDAAEIKQFFADVRIPIGASDAVTLRGGRQELYYGAGRVITPGDTRNTRNVFDAAKVIAQVEGWKVDAFLAKPVTVRPGPFDDVENDGQKLWGVYVTRPHLWQDVSIDLYYFGNQFKSFAYDQGTAAEQRNTFGGRVYGKTGDWDYDLEGNGQYGRFKEHEATGWLVSADGGYTWSGAPWTPRTGLRLDAASGDRSKSNQNLQTYQPLFPRGDYLGQSRFFAPSNIISLHPTIDFYPTKGLDLTLGTNTFWRESTQDGIYRSVTTQLMVPDGNSRAPYIGTLIEAQATWRINAHLQFLLSYAHLFDGAFLKSASTGKDLDYFAANVVLRF